MKDTEEKLNPIKQRLESKKMYFVNNTRVEDARRMIDLLHPENLLRVAICQKADPRFYQWILPKEDLTYKMNNIIAAEDVYISVNSFKGVSRKIIDLHSLNAFVIDLDYYKCPNLKRKKPESIIRYLRKKGLFSKIEPSFFVYSGNGMYIVYLIKNASPQCLKIWSKLMQIFYEMFKDYGADNRSLDAAHVFRLPGSKNSKTGNIARFIYNSDKQFRFECEKETIRRYTIPQLAEIILPKLPYTKEEYTKYKVQRRENNVQATIIKKEENIKQNKLKTTVSRLHTLHNLNYSRMKDLETLQEIRRGYCIKNGDRDVEGNREFMCFLYRYWACCYFKDAEKALNTMLSYNRKFVLPLPDQEVINATRSAEDAWELWEKAYAKYTALPKENKPNISKYLHDAGCYIYSNLALVKELEITKEEMRSLRTIILLSTQEKNNRNKEYRSAWKKNNRRNPDGLTNREQAKLEKIEQINIMLGQGLKQTEIAKNLGITQQAVSKLIKEIKNNNVVTATSVELRNIS